MTDKITLCDAKRHDASLTRGACAGLACLFVVGCAGPSAPSYKLEPPRAALMKAPEPLPSVSEGDDLYDAHARLRASYALEASKAAGLQKYVRVILKKQKGSP